MNYDLPALRDYQYEAVQSIFDYFESGKQGNPVIAMPTGLGKSWIIAGFIQRVLNMWANQRFMMLTHSKKLIVQDLDKLLKIWPNAPAGIYSAGLNQKDIMHPIIFGGMQSVVNVVEAFGHRDLLLIDEAHLVSPKENTTYQNIIGRMKVINPNLKVIGLTATKFRLGQGLLTDEGLFTDICHDVTTVDHFNRFLALGHLTQLIPKRTDVEIDVSELKIINGDYAKSQCDDAADKIIYEALKETVILGSDRNCWLVFASGIKSAEHAAEILTSFGISAAAIHSKIPKAEIDNRFKLFETGKLKALCGMGLFTTGFDHPPVDMIVMLRPTVSPGLWVQMLGRGTRPYNGSDTNFPYTKKNCLVLDFAGNTKRLGPINDPRIPRKKGKATGEVPIKICEACGTYNHAAARYCCNPECNFEFKFQTKLVASAYTNTIMRSDAPVIEYFTVDRVIYHRHEKPGSPPMIKVSYFSGLRRFIEFVCLEHSGWAKKKARDWFRQRYSHEPPETTDEALAIMTILRIPKRIRVWLNRKYPEIMGVEW